jgi:predicted GNAT family N-acyltransferase
VPAAVPRPRGAARAAGRGAAAILREADSVAQRHAAHSVSLHAQTYALRLYLDAGYEECGARFTEEGIEHVAMEKRLA